MIIGSKNSSKDDDDELIEGESGEVVIKTRWKNHFIFYP